MNDEVISKIPNEEQVPKIINDNGECITKRLDSVERTQRGNLLYNLLTDGIASMGNSISEQEKRQIVMDLLKDLCF